MNVDYIRLVPHVASIICYNTRMAKRLTKENLFKIGALVLTVAAFAGAVFAVSKIMAGRNESTPVHTGRSRQVFTHDGKDYYLNDNIETILVMGIDTDGNIGQTGKYVNNSQADVIYLFVIDNKAKTYRTLQLNRNTITGIKTLSADGRDTGITNMQLSLSHSYGRDDSDRCLNTVDAVSALLCDIDIDHYVSLTMDAIPVLNDSVGGVTVTVPEDMTAADPSFVKGATVTLHGDQAEKFVRSRMSLPNDTNEFRMQRQQLFMSDWRDKVNSKIGGDLGFALNMILNISPYMVSDMSVNALADFANTLSDYEDLGSMSPEGEVRDGELFKEFIVDQDDLEDKVVELFYEEAGN